MFFPDPYLPIVPDARHFASRGLTNSEIVLNFHSGGDAGWESKARRAFEFLRLNSSRRYSNSSLMRALNTADWDVHHGTPRPFLCEAEVPHTFDPDTEVKTGGLAGILVQLNDGTGRGMLAVADRHRRTGVGTALVKFHSQILGMPSLWVNRSNADAQQFLLSTGLLLQAMNSQGGLRFGPDETQDD